MNRIRPCALTLAVALALSGTASASLAATPGVDEPPAAGPAIALHVPPVVVRQLDNGVTVIVARRAAAPLVTMGVYVRAGAEHDPAGHAGLANRTATLLTRGARHGGRDLDSTGLARLAESMGGDLQAGSGFGYGTVSMTVTTPRVAEALDLVADIVRHPTFPQAEFARAQAEESDELRVRLSSPGAVASMAARRAFWGDSPYGASETPASLGRLQPAEVAQFHRTWFTPATGIAVVFAGDIDEATAMTLARQRFGDWAATTARGGAAVSPGSMATSTGAPASMAPTTGAPSMPAMPMSSAPALLAIDLGGVGQSGVAVAAPYVPLGSPQRYVAQVTNAVLGGGYSARLNEEVRVKRGLAYGASSRGDSQPGAGMMMARVQTNNATAGQVVTLVRDEIERLGQAAPGADELGARQATLVGEFGRELDTTASFARLVGNQWARGLPMEDLDHYVERVLAVSPEQVRGYAAATWKPDTLHVVVAGDASAAAEGLKPLMAAGSSRAVKLSDVDFERASLSKP